MKRFAVATLVVTLVTFLYSCKKKTETFTSASINDYAALQTGKTYIYRLDSTIIAPFGTALIVKSYQAKDSIESAFTDNLGRQSFRIFRYIRDTLATRPWRFAATYVATPTVQTLEYVDNNLRFIKLHTPIKEGYKWKAHSFIDTKINTTLRYLDEWEYEYRNVEQPYTVLNKTYDSTIIVFQHDETNPPVSFNPAVYQQKDYGVEVYAKGIGLIYKEFLHWTWQPNPTPGFQDDSYGVKLRLISHN
jgi:hypothetical protein